MSKARDLADFISTGSILSDGTIESTEISGVTADATEINKLDGLTADTAELNKLDGVTATTAELNKLAGTTATTSDFDKLSNVTASATELNYMSGATSSIQNQLDNISVTSGSLTKSFTNGETASITLSSALSTAPVVGVTKEVAQTGISSKGAWDVNATASNYELHNTAYSTTLTPSTVGYGFSSAIDDSNQLSYGGTDNYMQKLYISPDGLNVILSGNSPQTLYYWQLSTAWDLSTASYYSSFDPTGTIGANDISMLSFKSDGTKMYVGSYGNDYIYAFNLSTAWYINTATSASESFYIGGDVTVGQGFSFSSDGTKFYVGDLGNGDITEYSMSTAWDISSASSPVSYTPTNFPSGKSLRFVLFNSDGTKMYINNAHNSYLTVAEYSLSTAWDISTASPTGNNFDYSSDVGDNVPAFWLKPDGTKIFFMNNTTSPSKLMRFSISSDALVLGTGSFASTDVGKRIQGNGGDVILTSTAGAYDTTGGSDFTDTSTIASGSWTMHGLKSAGASDGLTLPSIVNSYNNISDWSYDSVVKDLSSDINLAPDLYWKPDGTRLYLSDYHNDKIKQFNLSTAWDISTAAYTAQASWSTASYGNQTAGVFFKPDGLKMYVTNMGYDYILQFNLTTAWEANTAAYYTSKDATATAYGSVNNPHNIYFKPDGTRFYMTSQTGDDVTQVDLATAWDLFSTPSNAQSFSTVGQFSAPQGLAFNSDGTKMYLSGNNSMWQYSLSTAWDVTTASYDSETLDIGNLITPVNDVRGIAFKDDGLKIYVLDNTSSSMYQFTTGSNTMSTGQYHIAATNSGGQIDTAFWTDINSMTADQSLGDGTVHYAVSTDDRTTWSVAKASDGVRPIVRNNAGTWQYNSDAGSIAGWGVSNATYDSKSFSVASQETEPQGIFIDSSGTRFYVSGPANDSIYQYSLSTAWDISTASHVRTKSLSADDTAIRGVWFKSDGTKMYVAAAGGDDFIYEYHLTTAWDISTAGSIQASIDVTTPTTEQYVAGLYIKSDGTQIWATGRGTDKIYGWTLTTAWDISTATSLQELSVSSQATSPNDIHFKSDGTELYVVSYAGTYSTHVLTYTLSTAWDITSATFSSSLDVSSQSSSPQGLFIKYDGTKTYVVGGATDTIYQYDSSTVAFGTSTTWTNATTNDEFYALQQALGATPINRMDKTQLDAVADGSHFTLGDTLDLAIALKQDTASASLPTSDGVSINYDAEALNQGAVLGTDYDYDFPDSTTVRITSNAAQNLKIRVV